MPIPWQIPCDSMDNILSSAKNLETNQMEFQCKDDSTWIKDVPCGGEIESCICEPDGEWVKKVWEGKGGQEKEYYGCSGMSERTSCSCNDGSIWERPPGMNETYLNFFEWNRIDSF